ncbi:hypothetical protein BG015_006479 [Linnemannia schmuckeri]|uniref:Exonuclease domain-containing protein n=1 Tax=Linnemannia schmuckeri TaxID=64567 RepID=A0A9P5S6E6_9FUNG|nr:hypothetical protein BG015_006479 [Linnemannia schmuckeri]
MGADKKRKHSKEEDEVKKAKKSRSSSSKSTTPVESVAVEEQDRPSKKTKKEKKDREVKEKKSKKEKKEKKEKKDKKEKKERKDKKIAKSDSSDDESSASSSRTLLSDTTVSVDMNMDIDEDEDEISTAPIVPMLSAADIIAQYKKAKESKAQVVVASNGSSDQNSEGSQKAAAEGAAKPFYVAQMGAKVDENGLTRKERRLLKIKQKQMDRKSEGDGEPAFNIKAGHEMLTLKDLRDLIVFILTETPSLPWVEVKNKFKIDKVVMIYVSGLDPQLFHINLQSPDAHKAVIWGERVEKNKGVVTELDYLRWNFEQVNVVKATGDKFRIHSPTNTLLSVPLSNSEKMKREKEKKAAKSAKNRKPENFMMTLEELRENSFPIPRYLDPSLPELKDGWIETPKLPKTTLSPPPKKMIAMDCEMCRTKAGQELTRVTLIDEAGKTVYDELVMPENPILDYLTQYSGMTAVRLNGVTTRLAEVQEKLKEFVDYNTILVGHSLENDMKVLKLAHPFIIDTSLVYHHTRGPPYRPGLKWLAQKWLQRQIQANLERGHDSAEDALACMDLIKLKLTKPVGFGEYEQDQESLFSRLQRFNNPKTSVLIDSDAFAGQSATTTVRTMSDEEVVAAVPEAIKNHNFVWARLRDIEINHGKVPLVELAEGQIADKGRLSKVSSGDKIQASEEEIRQGLRSVDKSIERIVESLPPRTAVIVTSGQGDHREVSRLQQRQKKFMELYKTKHLSEIPKEEHFLEADENLLAKAVEVAKSGVCFLKIKQ